MADGATPPNVATARAVLRALAIGLSVHRLYPDNPDATAFADACERAGDAARQALAGDGFRVEVRSGHFVVDDVPVTDPGVDRLAQACFERRVELIGLDGVPSRHELWAWFRLLSADLAELDRAGGLAVQLDTHGITTIVTTARAPMPATGDEAEDELLELATWVETVTDADPAAGLDELRLAPGEAGPQLYARLAALAAELSDDQSARSSFFARADQLVRELPQAERISFELLLLDRLADDPFAERYVGHLADTALAEVVAEVAWHQERDPASLAVEVTAVAGRHETLPRLFDEEALAAVAPRSDLEPLTDVAPLLDGFPHDRAQERALAALALTDVLLAEPREEQLAGILDNVVLHLRDAVRCRSVAAVADLLGALDTATDAGSPQLVARLEPQRARVLDVEVVRETCQAAIDDERPLDPRLLAGFGPHAIGPLVDTLASRSGEQVTQRALDLLAAVAGPHAAAVEDALARQPPEVVVRHAPELRRAIDIDLVGLLSRSARHAPAAVLVRIVDLLAGQGPERAAPVLVRIVRASDDPDVRQRAMTALGRLPDGAGTTHLAALGRRDGPAPLPWRWRRRARRLARARGGAS